MPTSKIPRAQTPKLRYNYLSLDILPLASAIKRNIVLQRTHTPVPALVLSFILVLAMRLCMCAISKGWAQACLFPDIHPSTTFPLTDPL